MSIDEAIVRVQDRLAREGGSMDELLGHFRNRISPVLIGDREWESILQCAARLPITVGAFPSVLNFRCMNAVPGGPGRLSDRRIRSRERSSSNGRRPTGRTAPRAHLCGCFERMDSEFSPLRDIVGRKVMLEYDIGRVPSHQPRDCSCGPANARSSVPAVSRPMSLLWLTGWFPVSAGNDRAGTRKHRTRVPDAAGRHANGLLRDISVALPCAQAGHHGVQVAPRHTRVSSAYRLAGRCPAVESVIERFRERANIVRTGASIDVLEDGVGPTLGLTLIVKQRYTKDSRYWLDGLTDWDPFLDALRLEDIVVQEKLSALGNWVAKPSLLFGKSGRYVMLRGIHHIKLVMSGDQLRGRPRRTSISCSPERMRRDAAHGCTRREAFTLPRRTPFPVQTMSPRDLRLTRGLPAATESSRDRFELFLGHVRVRRQREMNGLHVALVDLDGHGIGNGDTQFCADGPLWIRQKLLPEIRIDPGLLDNVLQHFVTSSHLCTPPIRHGTMLAGLGWHDHDKADSHGQSASSLPEPYQRLRSYFVIYVCKC